MTSLERVTVFPAEVIDKLCHSQEVLDLLANKRGAVVEDIEDEDGNLKCIFDYEYVEETIVDAKSFVCIETLVRGDGRTVDECKVYVHVICHKDGMRLDNKIFKGVIGSRRDNLIMEIDKVLRGSRDFGIGTLVLEQVNSFAVPPAFTGRTLVYDAPVFSRSER